MIDFKGSYFERDVILWGVRWYVAYPMSYRQLEAQPLGRQVCAFAGETVPCSQARDRIQLASR